MISIRPLTKDEFERLLYEAPDSETKALSEACGQLNMGAYDFFNKYAFEHFGLLDNGRPIYLAGLMRNEQGYYELWTVVNSNVTNQIALYRKSKRYTMKHLPKYGEIYATLDKSFDLNRKWTEKMGFVKCSENEQTITYKLSMEQLEKKPPIQTEENENGMRRQDTNLHCATCA